MIRALILPPNDVLQHVLSIMKERGFVHISIIDQDFGPLPHH
jgi:hypothetical protein